MRNSLLYCCGLALGVANTARHRIQGYVNPRPFAAADVDRTIAYAVEVVDRLEHRGRIDWTGRRILEIGPGPDLTTGAVMLHRGAASYHAVDLFDNLDQASADIYQRLGERLGTTIDESRMQFTRTSFPELPDIVGTYDVIVSNACLEHVADVEGLFRRLRDLAAPGSRMVHHVDAKAHMRWFRDHDPLNHLRYSELVYRSLLSFDGAPNRLRATDFAQHARAAAWHSVEVVPGRVAADDYLSGLRVTRKYRAASDLGLLTFTVIAYA